MDSLLSISSTKRSVNDELITPIPVELTQQSIKTHPASITGFDTEKEVLQALQNQPSFETLLASLKWLSKASERFNIKIPGPTAAQIVGTLVNNVVPNYWSILNEKSHQMTRDRLLGCLRSVAGIGALVARLKLSRAQDTTSDAKTAGKACVSETLDILDHVLRGDQTLKILWQDINQFIENDIRKQILRKEMLALLASGKILSTAAEASLNADLNHDSTIWLARGKDYSKWIGKNVNALALSGTENGAAVYQLASAMIGRAMSLGHNEHLIIAAFNGLLHGITSSQSIELELFSQLSSANSSKTLNIMLDILNNRFVSNDKSKHHSLISGASALIRQLCDKNTQLQEFLQHWLYCTNGGCATSELGTRRAVITALSSFSGCATITLQELLKQFGDKIRIQHAPILVQEVCTQNLLLLIGRVYRADSGLLKTIAKSSIFINAISNRLAASIERARFLGMIVGMSVSELVDDPGKRMKFTVDTINSPDAEWYLQMTGIQDRAGRLEDLKVISASIPVSKPKEGGPSSRQKQNKSIRSQPITKNTISKIIAIQEVSSSDSEDNNLPTYAKPDSDAEDSDDDPTLVNRNKSTPPVYIRDLISYLKDTENYDRQSLAMSHAASLIRRKTNYGTEVTDHINELASLFCGIKDDLDREDWQMQRVAAMIAMIVAQPTTMGKWFANMAFSGDFSIAQRASMLTAITMAARELAGYSTEDSDLTLAPEPGWELFPSKQLSPKYTRLYTSGTAALNSAVSSLEQSILAPLAAQAASSAIDQAGPKILQTRTFSTRMVVEGKKKVFNNKLSTLLAESFFFPLTNRWRVYTLSHGSKSSNIFSLPFLHAHLLKTLALLLAASGPGTTNLASLTTEFWTLLLSSSTRVAASQALPVLEAVLLSLLTILDINGAGIEGEDSSKRRLAEECGDQIVETRAWVGQVMEILPGGKRIGKEEERVRMLAAAVLIRVEEVVERYQRLLMGVLAAS